MAVDPFDQKGPTGNHIMFKNLLSFDVAHGVAVKEIDSTTVTRQDLLEWAGGDGTGFRLFSVDGGHSAEARRTTWNAPAVPWRQEVY